MTGLVKVASPVSHRKDWIVGLVVLAAWSTVMASVTTLWLNPWPDTIFRSDFISFWTGATLIRDGESANLFNMETQRAFQQQLRQELATTEEIRTATLHNPFHTPAAIAIPFLPLTWLPLSWAYCVWFGISALAMVVALAIPFRRSSMGVTSAVILLTYPGITANLLEGQVYGLFLLALAGALQAMRSRKSFLGGALLGLLCLEPQYAALFAIVLAVKRRWHELAGMIASGLALGVASVGIVGINGTITYVEVIRKIGAFYPPGSSLISPEKMANWRALLMNLWPGISEEAGAALVIALALATAAFSLLAWRGEWDPASPRFPRQMLVTVLGAIIASPHSHLHGTVLLLAPLAFGMAGTSKSASSSRWWPLIAGIGYMLSLVAFPLRNLCWILVPYFVIVMTILIVEWRDTPRRATALGNISPHEISLAD